MTSLYQLYPLSAGSSPRERWIDNLATRSPARFLRRVAEVLWETGSASLLDRFSPETAEIFEASEGDAPLTNSLALYLHWSPDGRISRMVRRQVRLWREADFACVFITNANPPAEDWAAIAENTALRIRRANVGRDFGAWRDAAAIAVQRFGTPGELLLTNDSVLGPFLPLPPLVDAWRAGGGWVFRPHGKPGRGHASAILWAAWARGKGRCGNAWPSRRAQGYAQQMAIGPAWRNWPQPTYAQRRRALLRAIRAGTPRHLR